MSKKLISLVISLTFIITVSLKRIDKKSVADVLNCHAFFIMIDMLFNNFDKHATIPFILIVT